MLSLFGFDIGLIRYLPRETDKGGMINSCFVMTGLAAALLSVVFLCGLHIWSPALLILRERAVFGAAFVLFVIVGSLAALQVKEGLRPLYPCIRRSLRSVGYVKYSFRAGSCGGAQDCGTAASDCARCVWCVCVRRRHI